LLRISSAVSITTVANWRSMSQKTGPIWIRHFCTKKRSVILIKFHTQKSVFGILNWTSILEDSCFYSSVPAEAVTIAILKDASFHRWCCFINRNVKSFKQTVFLSEQRAMSKVATSARRAVFRPWQRPTIVFPFVYCPVNNTLELVPFERLDAVSYSPSTVTMAVSLTVYEIFSVKE